MRAPVAIAVSTTSRLDPLSRAKHPDGLLIRIRFRPHEPLLSDLHAGGWIPPAFWPVAPFLRLGVDPRQDAAQVVHHVPGVAGFKKPLLHFVRSAYQQDGQVPDLDVGITLLDLQSIYEGTARSQDAEKYFEHARSFYENCKAGFPSGL